MPHCGMAWRRSAVSMLFIIQGRLFFFSCLVFIGLTSAQLVQPSNNSSNESADCYSKEIDENGEPVPQRCVPDFLNIAFGMPVEVTNECGLRRPTKYCLQTGHKFFRGQCSFCHAAHLAYAHPASLLTDLNDANKETWWQSDTMLDGIRFPKSVNLTLRFGKTFTITYVRLKFASPRPESFAIYKKTREHDEWTPWQYYSGSCRSTYKLRDKAPILPGNEAVPQCTREYSDISPLTGGVISFSTLEGRPSAENFEESEVLQDWVTASEIRISLDRINTFGDEIFGDSHVLRSYFYAISDLTVGGRCKCNGHARQCVYSTGVASTRRLVCDCQHHTTGVDCEQCAPFYVDRPWRVATSVDANECLPCNCNGLSRRCFFDEKLYEATGHGGHCIDCEGNTAGPHCEHCMPNHWRKEGERYCRPCNCNAVGSTDLQCKMDESGNAVCQCKLGVGGQHCDRCENGFYGFGTSGCRDCHCIAEGSLDNMPRCTADGGTCACKVNVEGQRCDKCKPGHFQLSAHNPFGCTPCFCYGHSSVCSSAEGFYALNMTSNFLQDKEGWSAGSDVRHEDLQWASVERAIAVSEIDHYPVYFNAPAKFLGDQRFAYNQLLTFTLRVQQKFAASSRKDVIIVGGVGETRHELTIPLTAQRNPTPSTMTAQRYVYRLHANPQFEWSPRLREVDFIAVLTNVTAIRIRGTFSRGDVGFLYDFSLGTAVEGLDPSLGIPRPSANWVEQCQCPAGHVGQFCERCAPGYRRVTPYGGPLVKCVRCACNGHSDNCDPESGACYCEHNTDGQMCESCRRGYYGSALSGEAGGCRKCDCPDDGPCMIVDGSGGGVSNETVCTDCSEGHTGRKCEYCLDDYFGNPLVGQLCQRCECNGNVDANAIGNCNMLTGECLKCVQHTTGPHCERCVDGFWGDATSPERGCRACDCYAPGAVRRVDLVIAADVLTCRQSDGQCECQPHVVGQRCDACESGFFNITSGSGCQSCDCDPLGSVDSGQKCDAHTGQCQCKVGVVGLRCDKCAARHFGFGRAENISAGCSACRCHEFGAESPDCDPINGQCLCVDNVEGRFCDRCAENFYNLRERCLPCDDCYALIQTRRDAIVTDADRFQQTLDDLATTPVHISDDAFALLVEETRKQVELMANKAESIKGVTNRTDPSLKAHVDALTKELRAAAAQLGNATLAMRYFDHTVSAVEERIDHWQHEREIIQRELNQALSEIQVRGRALSAEAKKRITEAKNREDPSLIQLTELAGEAAELARTQERLKDSIRRLSAKIADDSRSALVEAHDAAFGEHSKTSKQLQELEQCVREAQRKLNETRMFAADVGGDVDASHDRAARLLSTVEDVDVFKWQTVADDLRQKSANLEVDVEEVRDDETLFSETMKAVNDSNVLLTRVNEEADAVQKQLADARRKFNVETDRVLHALNDAQRRAETAHAAAAKVWENLNGIMDSLNALFNEDEETAADRRQFNIAEMMAKDVPEIERNVAKTNEKLDRLENAMEKARVGADESRRLAQKARDAAAMFAEPLDQLAAKSVKLRTSVDSALSRLSDVERDIGRAEEVSHQQLEAYSRNREKIDNAVRSAALAEQVARAANDSSAQSVSLLEEVLHRLESMDPATDLADNTDLDELEALLVTLETQYNNATGLTGRVHDAALDGDALQAERVALKSELDALAEQLINLENIRDTLPTKCLNKISLEQEGQ